MSPSRTVFWLKFASLIVIGFGLLGLTGALPEKYLVERVFMDLVFWPMDGLPDSQAAEIRLLWGINSGILSGWGIALWLITTRLYSNEPALTRAIILYSIGTWFIVDGLGSIVAGAPMNAVVNVGFLLLFAIPLWRPTSDEQ